MPNLPKGTSHAKGELQLTQGKQQRHRAMQGSGVHTYVGMWMRVLQLPSTSTAGHEHIERIDAAAMQVRRATLHGGAGLDIPFESMMIVCAFTLQHRIRGTRRWCLGAGEGGPRREKLLNQLVLLETSTNV